MTWDDHDLVFPNDAGRPLQENHVLVVWHRTLKALGIEGEGRPPIRMHDLRHTKGTLMIDEGEELVVVQRTLGHARQSITADLYVGKVPKALRRAADRFGGLLDPNRKATGS
ncbi:MAG: tyrosine-type recombinase/integrase [Chloroflexota bacterium]